MWLEGHGSGHGVLSGVLWEEEVFCASPLAEQDLVTLPLPRVGSGQYLGGPSGGLHHLQTQNSTRQGGLGQADGATHTTQAGLHCAQPGLATRWEIWGDATVRLFWSLGD